VTMSFPLLSLKDIAELLNSVGLNVTAGDLERPTAPLVLRIFQEILNITNEVPRAEAYEEVCVLERA